MKYCSECGNKLTNTNFPIKCSKCGTEYFDNPVPAVLVLVYNDENQIVITKKPDFPPDRWGLVSGYIEGSETAEETALREVLEETNLKVEIEKVVGTFTREYKPKHIFIGIIAKYLDGELKALDDISESKFSDPNTPLIHNGTMTKELVEKFIEISKKSNH